MSFPRQMGLIYFLIGVTASRFLDFSTSNFISVANCGADATLAESAPPLVIAATAYSPSTIDPVPNKTFTPVPERVAVLRGRKPATDVTRQRQAEVAAKQDLSDTQDFEDARRGLLAPLPNGGEVRNAEGRIIWNLAERAVAQPGSSSPDTVNPSLWRQAQLLGITGLFRVTDRIYQVRGLDLANITFIEGDTGLIVVDPLLSTETAKAGLELYYQHRLRIPVISIIITHSHADHFGGNRGSRFGRTSCEWRSGYPCTKAFHGRSDQRKRARRQRHATTSGLHVRKPAS